MKSGKEIKLNSINENFKIKAGAVENYKSPNSIFVNITSWLVTYNKVDDLNVLIKEYRNHIKKFLKTTTYVTDQFDTNGIVDIDISPTGIKTSKPTFFQLELNLYQKANRLPLVKPKNSYEKELKPILQNIVDNLIKMPIFASNQNFEFRLTKNNCSEE